METVSFILGALAVIGIAAVALVVVGTVKIYNLNKKQKSLENDLGETRSDFYRAISDESRSAHDRIESMVRHAQQYSEEHKREVLSYIDSRIDKLQTKREVLKG